MDWILKNVIQIATVVFVVLSLIRGFRQARNAQERHADETVESDEQRRVREIQERIRRKIAERRHGGPQPAEPDEVFRRPVPEPVRRPPEATQPPVTGGPLGDLLEQFQRKLQPPPEGPRLPPVNRGELERQAQLQESLRLAEEAKLYAARRAAHLVEEQAAVARSLTARRAVVRARLLADLQDPQSVRRAIVLREVLGTPVGLR